MQKYYPITHTDQLPVPSKDSKDYVLVLNIGQIKWWKQGERAMIAENRGYLCSSLLQTFRLMSQWTESRE